MIFSSLSLQLAPPHLYRPFLMIQYLSTRQYNVERKTIKEKELETLSLSTKMDSSTTPYRPLAYLMQIKNYVTLMVQ